MNQALKDLIKKAMKEDNIVVRCNDYIDCLGEYMINNENGWFLSLSELLKDGVKSREDGLAIGHSLLRYCDLVDDVVKYNPDEYLKSYKDSFFDMDFFHQNWNSDKKKVIITHANCFDGFGVELVALDRLHPDDRKNVSIIRADYNSYNIDDIVDTVRDTVVFVGDFSFSLEDMNKIKEVCYSFYLVDHHASPFNKATEEYTNCIFDKSLSGAVLSFLFFNRDASDLPAIIEFIGDRDTWNWFHDEKIVKATSLLLATYLNTENGSIRFLEDHEILFSSALGKAYEYLMDILKPFIATIEADDKRISDAISKYKLDVCIIDNVEFLAINYSDLNTRSELLNKLSTEYDKPAFSWTIKNNILHISLRSTSDAIDVNLIANTFGGGGHPRASGINISIDDIDLVSFIRGSRGHSRRLVKK